MNTATDRSRLIPRSPFYPAVLNDHGTLTARAGK